MFAILAEDDSDAEVLTHLVRRRLNNNRLPIRAKGYDGCAGLCRKGAKDIKHFVENGAKRIIVCHDADLNNPEEISNAVRKKIVGPSDFRGPTCIVIPVQEIEAWIIADEDAVNTVIPSFRFAGHPRPETINDPKEWIKGKSRSSNGKPLYSPATFNPSVAKHMRFDVVSRKCPSFQAFVNWLDTSA